VACCDAGTAEQTCARPCFEEDEREVRAVRNGPVAHDVLDGVRNRWPTGRGPPVR
jgi:hypothetical protein